MPLLLSTHDLEIALLIDRTIALLLALGEMLETPFRVMDEFDVFVSHQSTVLPALLCPY